MGLKIFSYIELNKNPLMFFSPVIFILLKTLFFSACRNSVENNEELLKPNFSKNEVKIQNLPAEKAIYNPDNDTEDLLMGEDEVTFFVTADTHFGFEGAEEINQKQVDAMNSLPGTPYPDEIGGRVSHPGGVLVAGDLTENGRIGELRIFIKYFGMKNKRGILKYPVYPGTGNHDRRGKRTSAEKMIRYYYSGLPYSWNWGSFHFICLDIYPKPEFMKWLKRDLKASSKQKGVIIFFHYSILGPYSDWWSTKAKRIFKKQIEGYNVIAIFHGHYHPENYYRWEEIDVYDVGAAKGFYPVFAVVRIGGGKIVVAYRNYVLNRWIWFRSADINKM